MIKKFFSFIVSIGIFLGCADIPEELRDQAEGKCSGNTYTEYQFCANGRVYDFCDGTPYNPSVVACCNNHQYTIETEFCLESYIYRRCGGMEYNPTNERCQSNVVEAKCGNDWLNPTIQYCSNGTVNNYGFVTYEGKTYKTVTMGTQTWMAENLNYAVDGSKCYDNQDSNCDIYGRLYNWATAMNLPTSCDSSYYCDSQIDTKHRGICPSGWHIPSYDEWEVLMTAIGGEKTAGRKLKATSGWYENGNGRDEYGFAALPGGYGDSYGNFYYVGNGGYWWSADAYVWEMYYTSLYVWSNPNRRYVDGWKSHPYSVRCLQD